MKEIILASASARRSKILTDCGITHRVVPSHAEEVICPLGKNVPEIVALNAEKKATEIAAGFKDAVIIGADTLVLHGENVLGKPADENEARDMLERFSGSEVEVYTGLCVIIASSWKKASGYERSSLKVVSLTADEIKKYFQLLAPYDKAGGFSIEDVGSLIFDDISGSYFNILGLPMIRLGKLLKEVGEDILDYVKST